MFKGRYLKKKLMLTNILGKTWARQGSKSFYSCNEFTSK